MPLIHIRVTHDDSDFLIEVAKWCSELKHNKVYLSCEETAEKKHSHTVCEYDLSLANFIKQFNAKYPQLIGNKSKSIALVRSDLTTNLEYISKGEKLATHPNIILMTITHDEMVEHHINYWSKYGRLKKEKLKEFRAVRVEGSAPKKQTWFENVCDEFIEDIGVRKFRWSEEDIKFMTTYVLRKLGKSRKMVDEFILKRFVLGLYNHYVVTNDDEKLEDHADRMVSKMFPGF